MNGLTKVVLALLAVLVFFRGIWRIGSRLNPHLSLDETALLRFVFVGVGLLIVLVVYSLTRGGRIWEIGTRQVVYMAIGAALYAIFSYLFNGTVFVVPSVSQVALRPAIAIPMFFGYAYGPVVGFFTGAVGNMFGDALTGFGLSPQWSVGNGLVGMVSGMVWLFRDKKRSLDIVLAIGVVLVAVVTLLYFLNPATANRTYYDATAAAHFQTPLSLLAGISVLLGLALVVTVRLVFAGRTEIAAAVTWAMLGNVTGIGFAAVSDIWINGYSPVVALVGEFIPSAGPNLIFAAVLVPILVGAYESVYRQAGR
jgi:hypothetical protein